MDTQVSKLTVERARELFSYDKGTGLLIRKTNLGGKSAPAGDEAGCLSPSGYRRVKVDYVGYLVHRVVVLMVTGAWPDEVDHIRGQRDDNRWSMLKITNRSGNGKNQKKHKTNTSGITGVRWQADRRKWAASIKVNQLAKNLGRFNTKREAIAARKAAEVKYGFHQNHGRA
jgi:hypothetical protein